MAILFSTLYLSFTFSENWCEVIKHQSINLQSLYPLRGSGHRPAMVDLQRCRQLAVSPARV